MYLEVWVASAVPAVLETVVDSGGRDAAPLTEQRGSQPARLFCYGLFDPV
jgi:hypothetical protein